MLFIHILIIFSHTISGQASISVETAFTNPVYNATICSSSISEPKYIYCPLGFHFNILNATLYEFKNCSSTKIQSRPLESIQNFIQKVCYTDTTCPIFKYDLMVNYPAYNSLNFIGVIVNWSCFQMGNFFFLYLERIS